MKRTDGFTLTATTGALINCIGTENSGAAKNLSTRRGVSRPSIPHLAGSVDGFRFFTMVKHQLDGDDYWTPTYRVDAV